MTTQQTILMVNRIVVYAEQFKSFLEEQGYKVILLPEGFQRAQEDFFVETMVKTIREQKVDLVVFDLNFLMINTNQVLQAVQPQVPAVKFIYLNQLSPQYLFNGRDCVHRPWLSQVVIIDQPQVLAELIKTKLQNVNVLANVTHGKKMAVLFALEQAGFNVFTPHVVRPEEIQVAVIDVDYPFEKDPDLFLTRLMQQHKGIKFVFIGIRSKEADVKTQRLDHYFRIAPDPWDGIEGLAEMTKKLL